MSESRDYLSPTGQTLNAHVSDRDIAEVDFSLAVTPNEAVGATSTVSFWDRVPGTGWNLVGGLFEDPEAEVIEEVPSVRFWVDAVSGTGAGLYGVKVVMTLTDGRELVSDHPLEIRSSVSND